MPEKFRVEKDTLGERKVPAACYYGIQTARAKENFPVSGLKAKPVFIKATALVKIASCRANMRLGLLDRKRGGAIEKAASEVSSGSLHNEFIVDVYQAGAGTSHNMNANEVIANRAIEILGGKKGDYSIVHPNDHVNMSQSTNDTMPAALRVAVLLSFPSLLDSFKNLAASLAAKSRELGPIIKSGRTHLQDAVPITLGQELGSYASSIRSSIKNMTASLEGVRRIGLGATAVGTGINTHPSYKDAVLKELSRVSGLKLVKAEDTFEALNSMADFTAFSSSLKNTAVELIRLANDLRLLSSGPRTGLAEIRLPALQPGSSIMPGKVNPVMAEMLNMVSFQVIGNDLTVSTAAAAGQLELNVMLPVINYNLLQSIEILTNAVSLFTEKCVKGIQADKARCMEYFERSAGLATILNSFIGYSKAAEVARESVITGRTIKEIALERGLLSENEWTRLMEPKAITGPMDLKRLKKKA